jgi:hypothetical protein
MSINKNYEKKIMIMSPLEKVIQWMKIVMGIVALFAIYRIIDLLTIIANKP